jgi:sucrose phosphorylase
MPDYCKFHLLEPDYKREKYQIDPDLKRRMIEKLRFLYGAEQADKCYTELERICQVYYAHKSNEMLEWEKSSDISERFTENDMILITYGDLVQNPGEVPLEILHELCKKYLKNVFNTLHILPFYPYSSDRGFAVMDFEEVDPRLGNWEDIINLKSDFRLMFDGVFNHVSSKSRWFQEYLNQNPEYVDFFTVFSTTEKISQDHLKLIVRPRTTNILTEYYTLNGSRMVWTTFSPDQIDVNFKNPSVLLKMIDILLKYIQRGADIIRLDAVTYLWEELGTTCVHLDQSHISIKLFRDVLDAVAPHVTLITETNVAHQDNIRYFGNGSDEAQMVYNFALPPLVLHAFQSGDTKYLSEWASTLEDVSPTTTFFNFLDSHDGIGVTAVRGILPEEEIEKMALRVLEHGGYISYKDNGDGSVSPYELNITWYSAINKEDADEPADLQIKRYLASRSIALVIQGVPGIYLHGLLGSKNDAQAVIEEKQTRSINRTTLSKMELLSALEDEESNIYQISLGMVRMIHRRIKDKAFHPNAEQHILNVSPQVMSVKRVAVDGSSTVLAIVNVTDKPQHIRIGKEEGFDLSGNVHDIIRRSYIEVQKDYIELPLEPYDVFWLKPGNLK